ncbi:MAG TPA: hypothetical protein VGB24_05615 [Longimicrobium sp.]|uniref:hypothetical protein n=1 Tax=Longimicrobium sp. TaxID=2029185 RepID=UPI002ED937EF
MGNIELIIAFLLTISLASERMVTILKTVVPALAEQGDPNSAWNQRVRPLIIQAFTFAFCCATAAMVEGPATNWFTGSVTLTDDVKLPVLVVGLLASGGSAFWNNFLGYTKAVKDLKKEAVNAAVQGKAGPEATTAVGKQVHVPGHIITDAPAPV